MAVFTKRRKEESGSLQCLEGVGGGVGGGLAVLEYSAGAWQQAASLRELRRWLNMRTKESR